jgi:hypothetical protein
MACLEREGGSRRRLVQCLFTREGSVSALVGEHHPASFAVRSTLLHLVRLESHVAKAKNDNGKCLREQSSLASCGSAGYQKGTAAPPRRSRRRGMQKGERGKVERY